MDSLFLDFDGVLCDSVDECFVSSWIACFRRYRREDPSWIHLESYRRFRGFRPFVRSGEDYVLIQALIRDGVDARSQADFDQLVKRAGRDQMATFRQMIYAVREELLDTKSDYWLGLHRPMHEVQATLGPVARLPEAWIVSTKKPAFINRILSDWGISWPIERIVMPVSQSKVALIDAIMRDHGWQEGLFIDDQIDHLACSTLDPRRGRSLECRLAEWGYVTPAVVASSTVASMTLAEMVSMLSEWGAANG